MVGRNDQPEKLCFLELDGLMFARQYALMMLGRSSSVSTKMSFVSVKYGYVDTSPELQFPKAW